MDYVEVKHHSNSQRGGQGNRKRWRWNHFVEQHRYSEGHRMSPDGICEPRRRTAWKCHHQSDGACENRNQSKVADPFGGNHRNEGSSNKRCRGRTTQDLVPACHYFS
jgi:hypothetical protein